MISLRRAGILLRRFIMPGVLYGILAACVSPVRAQNFSPNSPVALSAAVLPPVRVTPSIGQGSLLSRAISSVEFSQVTPFASPSLDASEETMDSKWGLLEMVESFETPFLQQTLLPLGSLFGGRITLCGFNAVSPTENIQRGLSGGGSMDPWAPVPMGRGGMILPKDDNRYGFSLTFFQGGGAEMFRGAKLNEIVGWVAGKNFRRHGRSDLNKDSNT